jgi:predicted dehydrogenase
VSVNEKIKIGIVGIGSISGIYLDNLTTVFKEIEIIGVCDLIPERAETAASTYKIPKVYSDMHELFADPEVDIVLNLTRPYEHFDVSSAAIIAGKHLYSEKPLGATFEEGAELMKMACEKGVLVGCAPDTFLGAGIQTCRKLIDDGFIGTPVAASAFMVCRGHETWHPDPAFYYQFGGGPMLDMGPYYVTALVSLLGSVETVTGMTKKSFETRTITSEPHYGEVVQVEVPTNVNGLMQFENGVVASIYTTFDAYKAEVPRIEIYGSEGTLSVPDPNIFGGSVRLYRKGTNEFKEIPLLLDYPENSRGLGLADMAKALQVNRPYRANGKLALHVLEILTSFQKSSEQQKHIKLQTSTSRPEAMGTNHLKGVL